MSKLKKVFYYFSIVLTISTLIAIMNVSAQEYRWKLICPVAGSADQEALDSVVRDINVATNNQIKIDIFYPGEHPYKSADFLRAVSTREIEMVGIIGGYISGIEPIFGLVDLPLLIPNGDFEVYLQLFEKLRSGYFKEVFANWNIKECFTLMKSGQEFYLKDGWIENFDSLKGKKIRTWCTEVTDFIKLMNGIPVSIPLGENYTALQTGLLDGTTTNIIAADGNNIFDLCKHVVISENSFSVTMYVINQEVWNELPGELQKIVTEVFENNRKKYERVYQIKAAETLQKLIVTKEVKASPIPKAFRQELVNRAYDAIWKPWIDRSGEDGQKAFDLAVSILEEMGYKISVPKK